MGTEISGIRAVARRRLRVATLGAALAMMAVGLATAVTGAMHGRQTSAMATTLRPDPLPQLATLAARRR